MRLLDLPSMVQEMGTVGELSMGHARALIGVPDCEGLARAVADKGLSVRETEKLATRAKPGRSNGKISVSKKSSSDDADLASLEQHRSEEHTSELQSLMRISYAVFCLKKKKMSKVQHKITITYIA